MPAFSYDPFNPGATYLDPARNKAAKGPGGFTRVENDAKDDGNDGGGGAAPVAAPPKPPKKKPGKKKPPKREAYNPLTAPFLTPRQIREEAARLAALSVANEQTLRDESARQESGLSQLTGSLTGTLTGIGERQTAAMQGLGNLYSTIAQGAQQAGQTAAAAAGAPTEIAQGATPMVAASMANLTAPLQGYAPAAAATGARLVGEARGALTKALADRANQISANTAKYLQQLQGTELERAVANVTAQQNATRLGLSAQEQAQDFQIDQANLGLREQTVAQGWARLAQSAAKAAQSAGSSRTKKVQAVKNDILENLTDWTNPSRQPTGKYDFTVQWADSTGPGEPVRVQAASMSEAITEAKKKIPVAAHGSIDALQGDVVYSDVPVDRTKMIRRMRQVLVNSGMSQKAATQWINRNVLPLI